MGKNIIVCCDGTGNEYGDRNSNVVRLFSVLRRNTPEQVAFYDPGVGTFSVRPSMTRIMRGFWRAMGLGFGIGLGKNIIDAYTFVMQNYMEGDRVFIFGFSRGAYTARSVAAMLIRVGVLGPHNANLIPYAMRTFRHEKNEEVIQGFKETFAHSCPIHMLGIWDTVTSVGWAWDPIKLPGTLDNPGVAHVRHALSIDERRAFYRQSSWTPHAGQDVKQVWFAGVHSDVGGSYPEPESGLAKIAFEWMLAEAYDLGLAVDVDRALALLESDPKPDHGAMIHRSLRGAWWPLEAWPKLVDKERDGIVYRRGIRVNLGRRRTVDVDPVLLHASAAARLEDASLGYAPPNIPSGYRIEPRRAFREVVGK